MRSVNSISLWYDNYAFVSNNYKPLNSLVDKYLIFLENMYAAAVASG